MTVLLLHGSGADEFLLAFGFPLLLIVGLYWWADRKSKRARAARDVAGKREQK